MRWLVLAPLISLSLVPQQSAICRSLPDSCRVVVLSDRVGEAISAAACEQYNLFTKVRGFSQAVVVELPDSSCAVVFSFQRGGAVHDSLVRFSWPAIAAMAEQIDHYHEIEHGEYVMGRMPVRLRYAWPEGTRPPEFVPPGRFRTPRSLNPGNGKDIAGPDSIDVMWSTRIAHYANDTLPLTRAGGLNLPRHYPALAIAAGFRTISPNLSGLESRFLDSPSLRFSPLFNIVPELLLTSNIGLQLDWAYSLAECFAAGATVVLYTYPFEDQDLRPYLEVGVNWTYIHVHLQASGDPAAYMKASSEGIHAGVGMEIGPLVLAFSYELMAKQAGSFDDWGFVASQQTIPVSVNLSSFRFDLRLKFQ